MELLVGFGCEKDTAWVYPTISCLLKQIIFRIGRVLEKPEDTVRDSLQNIHPASEGRRIDLVKLVKVSKNELVLGKTL